MSLALSGATRLLKHVMSGSAAEPQNRLERRTPNLRARLPQPEVGAYGQSGLCSMAGMHLSEHELLYTCAAIPSLPDSY